jgi:HD-GYP domain-containing protein (c-di-GMP phosphodiesterase class II)/CHASE2 domain-containing sensor protein
VTRSGIITRILLISLISLVGCFLAVQQPDWLEKIERWSLDQRLRSLPWQPANPPIVLIEAGEKTFAKLKTWPWSRQYHADLLDHLIEADTVVMDILFPERGDPAADTALTDAVRRQGRTIVAMHLVETVPGAPPQRVFPYVDLQAAARRSGYTNVTPDIDGLVRFAVPLRQVDDGIVAEQSVPSLSLAAARQVLDAPPAHITQERSGRHLLRLGPHKIPLDAKGRLWLQYAPRPYPVYEYADVLEGRWSPETFRDKVVVIGVSASGAEDFYMVPGAGENLVISGARLNAEIIRCLLVGQGPTRARPITDLLLTVGMIILAAELGRSAHRWRSSLLFLGLCLAYAGLTRLLFTYQLHWVHLSLPLMGGASAFFSSLFFHHRWQRADLEFRTYSMDAILKLSTLKLPADQTLEGYLASIWPEIEKGTGVRIVTVSTTAETAVDQVAVNPDWGKTFKTGEIIEISGHQTPRKSGGLRHQILIPYVGMESGGTQVYLHLGCPRPIPRALSETLATLVTAISWFFDSLQAARRRKRMLMDTIHAIFTAVDFKDPITGGHSNRVSDICKEIIAVLDLDSVQAEDIYLGSLIHDIGKIGIPDAILNKPGRLTDGEFDKIRSHPDIGKEILATVDLPKETMDALYHHHERYDGSGYPQGLKGDQISLAGRIVAVADVFDALSADRPYRGPLPLEEVCGFIEKRMGTDFDPRIAQVLLKLKAPRSLTPDVPPKKAKKHQPDLKVA